MKPNSLQTRAVIAAQLFGPPRFVTREEASAVYGALCEATRQDDFSFRYSSPAQEELSQARRFAINLERTEGRGGVKIAIDTSSPEQGAPLRLLMEYVWPPSLEHVNETFDIISQAVYQSLDGDWQRVLAEVRLRAQCDSEGNDARAYLGDKILGSASAAVDVMGTPLGFASVKIESIAQPPLADDPLYGPKRELSIEVLREQHSRMYIELMSQWPQVSVSQGVPPVLSPDQLRTINEPPSAYIGHAYEFLGRALKNLWAEEG